MPALSPHAIIGGAPRSGTTFLCEVLDKHPDIFVAKPFIPEPKVMTRAHPRGPKGHAEHYATIFRDAPGGAVRVEKTSNYFENLEAADRIARLLPETSVIFLLREPVARAYSNWLWSRQNGLETLSFREAIRRELHDPRPLPEKLRFARPFDYLTRGRYGSLSNEWLSRLGHDRLAFLLYEDFVIRPDTAWERLQSVVSVRPIGWDRVKTGVVNATSRAEQLDPEFRRELRRHMAPEVAHLAAVTGIDVSSWGYDAV